MDKKITNLFKRVASNVIEKATVGIVDAEYIIGDEDSEIEEEQLLQIIAIRQQNSTIIKQNDRIIDLLETLVMKGK